MRTETAGSKAGAHRAGETKMDRTALVTHLRWAERASALHLLHCAGMIGRRIRRLRQRKVRFGAAGIMDGERD